MGRFPVTLYKKQWLRLLDMSDKHPRFHRDKRSSVEGEGVTRRRGGG
jgi:hypothetical protein